MRNARLDEAQAGIKIVGRNINNLRYVDDTTLMAECEEYLKSLLIKVKESGKSWLKLNIHKTKIMAFGPITSWQIDGETVETVTDFIFLGSKITAVGHCSHEIRRCLLSSSMKKELPYLWLHLLTYLKWTLLPFLQLQWINCLVFHLRPPSPLEHWIPSAPPNCEPRSNR